MRRSDSSLPFDRDSEAESDLTQEFWGPSASWQSGADRPSRRVRRIDDTSSMRALRDGVAAFRPQRVESRDQTGQVRRIRTHGEPSVTSPSSFERRSTATIGDLAAGHFDDELLERPEHDLPLTPAAPAGARVSLGAVDPLLARLGALVLAGVLLVPVALALRPASNAPDSVLLESPAVESEIAVGDQPLSDELSPAATMNDESSSAAAAPDGEATPAGEATTAVVDTAVTPTSNGSSTALANDAATSTAPPVGDAAQSVDEGISDAATVDALAERVVPACPQTYSASPGDSWYRIADAAGVSPSALLAENRATVDTVIFVGDEICLPEGATVPAPPPVVETTTPSTAPDSTEAPTTTEVPTTTTAPAGSPGRDASVDEVKAVIRSVFPESEWNTAFEIVSRESRFDPVAYNGWCCHGLFQIYWSVHRSWLDDLGIHASDDLYDPLLNTKAAFAIWQRSGNSWSAWSTYDG